ncbi:hypothetical protein RTBOTA2_005204 [Rhodotorula toruloides]|uniref:Uncharacterized protein n=1 Tax=Rhodotorula toruloides TaxID=5286 RepID=A0A2T0A8D2_RHOTO|nr:hypothetical protein RTBOTA2_005204 [Rhodotorula toruloides]PRQ74239.1 hypothetical protein AAT19DRAFT_14592 [Rhodotorula toruloides]
MPPPLDPLPPLHSLFDPHAPNESFDWYEQVEAELFVGTRTTVKLDAGVEMGAEPARDVEGDRNGMAGRKSEAEQVGGSEVSGGPIRRKPRYNPPVKIPLPSTPRSQKRSTHSRRRPFGRRLRRAAAPTYSQESDGFGCPSRPAVRDGGYVSNDDGMRGAAERRMRYMRMKLDGSKTLFDRLRALARPARRAGGRRWIGIKKKKKKSAEYGGLALKENDTGLSLRLSSWISDDLDASAANYIFPTSFNPFIFPSSAPSTASSRTLSPDGGLRPVLRLRGGAGGVPEDAYGYPSAADPHKDGLASSFVNYPSADASASPAASGLDYLAPSSFAPSIPARLSAAPASSLAIQLDPRETDYLESLPPTALSSVPLMHLILGMANRTLDTELRQAALVEFDRRLRDNLDRLTLEIRPPASITPPPASVLPSPRPASPSRAVEAHLPSGASIVSVEMADGTVQRVNLDLGLMSSASTLSDVDPRYAEDEASEPIAVTPYEARERMLAYARDHPPPPPAPKQKSMFLILESDKYARLGFARRTPTREESLDSLAAVIVIVDFFVHQARIVASQHGLRFSPADSTILPPNELRTRSTAQLQKELDTCVSTAAVVIARNFGRFAQQLTGVSNTELKKRGIDRLGAHLNWDEIMAFLPSGETDLKRNIQKFSGPLETFPPLRTHYKNAVTLSLRDALDRIAYHEPESMIWAPNHPQMEVDRSYEAMWTHPAYQNVTRRIIAST